MGHIEKCLRSQKRNPSKEPGSPTENGTNRRRGELGSATTDVCRAFRSSESKRHQRHPIVLSGPLRQDQRACFKEKKQKFSRRVKSSDILVTSGYGVLSPRGGCHHERSSRKGSSVQGTREATKKAAHAQKSNAPVYYWEYLVMVTQLVRRRAMRRPGKT